MQFIEENYPARLVRQGELLQMVLDRGDCMVLLDGLDEVGDIGDTLIHTKTLRETVIQEVQRFSRRRCSSANSNCLIVTSRLEGYRRGDLAGFC